MLCWKCHEPASAALCASCGAIQPPRPDVDHFLALGLPRRYSLSAAEIDAAWRSISRQVHPDRFVGKPAVERRMSLQWTAAINEARRALRDPLSRARYLATGRSRPAESGGPALSPDFLEEVFELQMDAKLDPEGVAQRAQAARGALLALLEGQMAAWEAGSGDLSGVEELLARLRYFDNALSLVAPAP